MRYVLNWMLVLLPTILSTDVARADQPEFDSALAVRSHVELFEKLHISHKPLDDQLAARWFDAFLERLDPRRMYFLQADYAEFQPFESQLVELAKSGDMRFAKLVGRRYTSRVAEIVPHVEEFLAIEHDYTTDEHFDISHVDVSRDSAALRERWRLRIKAELLVEKVHGTETSNAQSWLLSRYRRIAQQAQEMTDERLCDVYLNSLSALYDSHSAYMNPSGLVSFDSSHVATYSMRLRFRPRAGCWSIANVFVGFENHQDISRLMGWNLLAIRRADGQVIDVVEMHQDDLIDLVRLPGKALKGETEVILELQEPVTLERQSVSWPRIKRYP